MALATMKELEMSGHGESFDVFVLSDTTDPDLWVHEEAAFNAARARPGSGPRLYYRRRATNTGKKAGNIADWCRRWGPAYDYCVLEPTSDEWHVARKDGNCIDVSRGPQSSRPRHHR